MLTRRAFGILVATAPFAAAKPPALWSGSVVGRPGQGTIRIGDRHVRLRNRATARELVMLSQSNDNAQWMLWVVLPKQHEGDYQYLNVDGQWWSSQGTGFDAEGTKTTFQFDRPTARRVARALGIPLHARMPLGEGLRYAWRFPPRASLDKTRALPVVLRIENAGTRAVGFAVGGRQRGPRDNRFVFAIARNGAPVTIKDGPDFGGIGTYSTIQPGKSLDVTCADLRAWHDLDVPGYYTIEARYEGELAADGKFPTTAADRARLWDVAIPGQGSILVQ